MTARGKTWTAPLIGIASALFVLLVGWQLWSRTGLRTRPWHLEAYLDGLLAQCRTNTTAPFLHGECAQLAVRTEEARRSLEQVDGHSRIWRDYSDSVSLLLDACLHAQRLRLEIIQHRQEQKQRLAVLLAMLEGELQKEEQEKRTWSGLGLRSIEKSRAATLLDHANRLGARGEVESALRSILAAWEAWRRFDRQSEMELARFKDPKMLAQWEKQASALIHWTQETGQRAILIDKLEHRCMVLSRGVIERSYPANLGRNWYRNKVQENDASTPEGDYKIKKMIPAGRYGPALLLDFPNPADRKRIEMLKREGVIPLRSRMGGNLEIHGAGRLNSDWTDGCVSVNDEQMRHLYRLAYPGMPVTIVGTAGWRSAVQEGTYAVR